MKEEKDAKMVDLFALSDPNYHAEIGVYPKWRIGDRSGDGFEIYPYYDSDQCEAILDSVVGVAGWGCEYREVAGMLFCSISLTIGDQIVEKSDAGGARNSRKKEISEVDRAAFEAKSAASGAFVRAAAKWGIGRHLSLLPKIVLKGAGSGSVLTPDGQTLNGPIMLTNWCNKMTASMRYLISIYQLNKIHFDSNPESLELMKNMRTLIESL